MQQHRLYFDGCFTDDLAAAIVGVERTTRYLMAWHEVTTRFNIMMAPPRKRQLGCRLLWVGALLLTIGLVTVSLQKRIRAIYKLKLLLAGKLSMSQLQKLNGLLQHFVSVFALKNNWTSGMYVLFNAAEMDGGVLRHPEARAEPTRHMEQTAGKWLVCLRDLVGSSACTFTSERNPITELSRFISSHSDAASEVVMGVDPDTGLGIGLGAYSAGYWWNWPLSVEAQELPIAVLELLALALSILVFGPLLKGVLCETCRWLLHCDSSPAVQAVIFENPRSPMMQFVHRELHGTPIFKSVKKYLAVVHEKGLGNLMGDAASRARIDVLKATAAAMRIKCVQLTVPRHAVDFIGRACAYFRSLSLEEQGRAVSQPQNPNPASFAMQMLGVPNMVPNEPLLSVVTQAVMPVSAPLPLEGVSGMKEPVLQARLSEPTQPIMDSEVQVIQLPGSAVAAAVSSIPFVGQKRVPKPQPGEAVSPKKRSKLQVHRLNLLHELAHTAAADIAAHMNVGSQTLSAVLPNANLEDMLTGMFVKILDSVPAGTADINARDWEKWSVFVRKLDLQPWRGDVRAHQGYDVSGHWTEQMLQALAFMDELRTIQPKSNNAPAAKPTSVTICTTVRRIHKYFGVTMASGKVVAALLKSQIDAFIENHGIIAFNPKRKEPFRRNTLRSMVNVHDGTVLHTVIVDKDCRTWRSILLLIHVMVQTGLRLADALRLNSDAKSFVFRGKILPVALPQMAGAMDESDYAQLLPGRTKSDPLCRHWASFPMYLPVRKNAAVNAAQQLYWYDADFPVAFEKRSKTPLFCDSNMKRLTRPLLEKVLNALLSRPEMDCNPAVHSWHSFRITLAMQLKSAGADSSVIKSMVRWISDDAMRIHARDNRKQYADYLDRALKADVEAVQAANLPEMDDDAVFAVMHGLQSDGLLDV